MAKVFGEKKGVEYSDKHYPIEVPRREAPFWELLKFALVALLIVIPIRAFVAQPFIVNGESMMPTFRNNEYLIVDEVAYHFKEPDRGEVIIFRYPRQPSKFFIKRIVGLPGETITIDGPEVYIKNEKNPEGFLLAEPYVKYETKNDLEIKLSDSEYFVMGDNRAASSDSRVWGPLQEKFIVGRAWLRLLPLSTLEVWPGRI